MKQNDELRCEVCGAPIERRRWANGKLEAVSRWLRRRFCSIRCAGWATLGQTRETSLAPNCVICGAPIERRRRPNGKWEPLTRWEKKRFCSNRCIGKAKSEEQPHLRIGRWIDVDPVTGCWNWLGARDRDGYGQLRYNFKRWKAHRFAYEVFNGPIPEGLELDHLCCNPSCCNPEHVEAVTTKEHQRREEERRAERGRREAETEEALPKNR